MKKLEDLAMAGAKVIPNNDNSGTGKQHTVPVPIPTYLPTY